MYLSPRIEQCWPVDFSTAASNCLVQLGILCCRRLHVEDARRGAQMARNIESLGNHRAAEFPNRSCDATCIATSPQDGISRERCVLATGGARFLSSVRFPFQARRNKRHPSNAAAEHTGVGCAVPFAESSRFHDFPNETERERRETYAPRSNRVTSQQQRRQLYVNITRRQRKKKAVCTRPSRPLPLSPIHSTLGSRKRRTV